MARQYKGDGGFIISYFFNLIFHGEWLAVAFVLFVLNMWLGVPAFLWMIALAVFFVWPLIITLFLTGISNTTVDNSKPQKNKNPYSRKTSDYNHKE